MSMGKRSFSAVLIGQGSMPVECARLLLGRGHHIRGVVSPTPQVREWAAEQGLPVTDFGAGLLKFLMACPFDYLFSIVNPRKLPAEILKLPQELPINFHDALLPRDAGMYASTWAILNGARQHGVTWHVMTTEFDSGDILKQRTVPIETTDTSYTLNVKCLLAGTSLFTELVDELADRRAIRTVQDPSLRTYHTRTARPHSALTISWRRSAQEIDAAVRATDFGSHPNEFGTVKLWCPIGFVIVRTSELCAESSRVAPGTVVSMSPMGVTVATVSHDIRLSSLSTLAGAALSPHAVGLRPGYQFPELDREHTENLTAAYRDAMRHEPYWVERLADLIPLDLPHRETSTATVGYHTLPVETPTRYPAETLLAATLAFLSRVTGEADLGVGLRWHGKSIVDPQLFASAVPVRIPVSAGDFTSCCAEVRRRVREVCEHGTYARDIVTRYPRLHDNHWISEGLPITVELIDKLDMPAVPDPATVLLVRIGREGECHWLLTDPALSGHTAAQLRDAFITFLRGLESHDLAQIPLVSPEQQHLLTGWNNTTHPTAQACLPTLFETQAHATPEAVAVVFEDTVLTYAQLNASANQLAHVLISRGVGPEQIVALALPRSTGMIVAILAVLKAGAAYLPLDLDYPSARIACMLHDARPILLLTNTQTENSLPGIDLTARLVLDHPGITEIVDGCADTDPTNTDRTTPLTPHHPAYVIYTSGSTGQPHGVVVSHAGISSLAAAQIDRFAVGDHSRVLQFASSSFDASFSELCHTLLSGAALIVAPTGQLLPGAPLAALVERQRVTQVTLPPSVLAVLPLQEGLPPGATLVVAGEACPPGLIAPWSAGRRMINAYGPTETTVCATISGALSAVTPMPPPIGRPIFNTRVYVLDTGLQPMPPGVPGELYISGAGLARGYLHRAGLTAGRFVADPYGPAGTRMYRTGDLARWRGNGDLEFLGRVDDQVKLRGFRIEPGEIEAAIATHPDIAQAAVIIREDRPGNKRLVAYVVSAKDAGPVHHDQLISQLREYLGQRLPGYMIPAAFVALDRLPLTPNGKLNRNALPVPDLTPAAPSRAPQSAQEQILCELFAEVLGLDRVGVQDSFFALGGDSIISIQLVSRARRAGVVISAQDVFEHKTVAALAAVAKDTSAMTPETPDAGVGVVPLTPIMHWLRERGGSNEGFSLGLVLQAPAGLAPDGLARLVQALLDCHDLLRARLERAERDGQGWALRVEPVGSVRASECIVRVEAAGLDDENLQQLIQMREAPAAIARLAPRAGVMIQVVWLDRGPVQPGRLMMMIHNLVVDSVSLRILAEDLATGGTQVAAGAAPMLQPCPTSFRRWAQLLADAAHDPVRVAELAMWTAMLHDTEPLLGDRALDPVRDTAGTCRELRLALPTPTGPLLTNVPAAFHSGVDDVLLCALVLAIAWWHRRRGHDDGQGCVLVDLEGHGRQERVVKDVDLSRTLGWFTSLFPIRLDVGGIDLGEALAGGPAAGQALKRVKEQLRTVPDHGLGFGLLRYLNPETEPVLAGLANPQIAFKYLGRFAVSDTIDWAVAPDSVLLLGGAVDAALPAAHGLEINAWTEDRPGGPQLHASWLWPAGLLTEDAVRELAKGWFQALDALTTYAARPGAGGYTPSDFPLVGLSQEEMDDLATERMIERSNLADILPLSPLQEGLLFHTQLDAHGPDPYTTQAILDVDGHLDAATLHTAGQALLDRHPNLRAAFHRTTQGRAVACIPRQVHLPWQTVDLSNLDPTTSQAEATRLFADERARRFNLAQPPLIRMLLVCLGAGRYRLGITNHHILRDGWSFPVLARELFALYASGGDPTALPPVTPYRDYLAWLGAQDRPAAETAWRDTLAGLDEPTLIAGTDQQRVPLIPDQLAVALSEELTSALIAQARRLDITPNTMIQGAWGILLGRLTNRGDVVFGITVSGRPADLAGVESMVGLFVNTVPVRVRLRPHEQVGQILTRLQAEQAQLLAHQHLSLVNIHRLAGLGQLFDTLVAYENYPVDPRRSHDVAPGLRITGQEGHSATHYPLSLIAVPGSSLALTLHYRSDALDGMAAQGMLGRLVRVLEQLATNPDQPIGRIDILDAAERHQILVVRNDTTVEVPQTTLPVLFEAQAQATPDAIAVVFAETTLTYAQLNTKANRLARMLIAHNIGPEHIVALALRRSVDLIVSVLAVIKAGAAYLPLDLDYPTDRLAFMIEDAEVVCLVTVSTAGDCLPDAVELTRLVLDDPSTAEELAALPDHDLDDGEQASPLHLDHPVYVIYTSGSTGRPKGVVVTHRAAVNHMLWTQQAMPLSERDTVLHRTSVAFDASVWELFAPLIVGARVLLASPDIYRDSDALAQLVAQRNVTVLRMVPSLLQPLLEHPAVADWHAVRRLLCGGEAFASHLWEQCRSRLGSTTVYNLYGPTEACIDVSFHACRDTDTTTMVPIGQPIANTRMYVLDAGLQLVVPGVVGELYIAGESLARCYLGRPGLTAQRFVADPYHADERMYRTGDLARWRGEGNLEFVGRADDQVKVRGFRIEPGEIEAVLATHPDITHTAVIAREDLPGNKRLVAYVVTASGDGAQPDLLREYLGERLPEYMVPAAVVVLDALPLTPNGKLNRNALPAPDLTPITPSRAPQSPQEQILCELFAELLGLDRIGVEDDFFTLGGDSIISIQLVSRARRAGVVISPREVFERKTVARLAAVARDTPGTAREAPDAGVGLVPLTPIMCRLFERGGPIDQFSMRVVVQAPAGLDADGLLRLVQAMLDRHDMLRARLQRPADDQRWVLWVGPAGSVLASECLVRVDAAGLDDGDLRSVLAQQEAAAAAKLAPRAGVMLQLAWLDRGPELPGRLLVVIHHLVVDGVSWRILLEELAAGWAQMAAGGQPVLEPCQTSFRRWAQLLAAAAQDRVRAGELAVWTAMLARTDPPLGERALDPARDTVSACREIRLTLPASAEQLLTSVPAAFHAGVEDVLLCGLALAVLSWRRRHGRDGEYGCVLVDLEGHGRQEHVVEGVDLSRTIGWFTTIVPVRLDLSGIDLREALTGGPAAGQALKQVKEQLHAVPDHGLGYGLLRYLNEETRQVLAGLAAPQIVFNYLGRFAARDTDWAVIPAGLGSGADTALPVSHCLGVNAWVADRPGGPQMHVSWSWPAGLLSEDAVRELAEGWFQALDALVAHAACPDAGGHTASDFPLAQLSQKEMDNLAAEWVT